MQRVNKYTGGDYVGVDKLPNVSSVIDAPTQQPRPTVSIGAPGAVVYNGFLITDERDPRLSWPKKYTLYSDILANVSIVAAGCRFFLALVSKADWTVEPADESKAAGDIAAKVLDILHDMETPWHRIVRRAAMFRFYGFSVQEWTAKKCDDGTIGFLDVESRGQSTIFRWDMDPHGTVDGVVQLAPTNQRQIYIPRQKLVYLVDDAMNDSPEGVGLLRHLVKAADKLAKYELLEAWGYETDIRGIPIGRAPLRELNAMGQQGAREAAFAKAQTDVIKEFMEKHIRGPGLGVMLESETFRSVGDPQAPSAVKKFDVELLKGDSGPHQEIAAAIERLNREMARVMGVEHLLLGSDSRGSHAMSQDKTQSFGEMVDSTLVEIKSSFEKDLLEPLFRLNGWDRKLMPTFGTTPIAFRDIQTVTGALRDMAQAGAPLAPNDPAVNVTRRLIGLPDMPEQDLSLVGALGTTQTGGQPLADGGMTTPDQGVEDQPLDNTPEESDDSAPAPAAKPAKKWRAKKGLFVDLSPERRVDLTREMDALVVANQLPTDANLEATYDRLYYVPGPVGVRLRQIHELLKGGAPGSRA